MVVKTFSTDETIYKEFKKTCIVNDDKISDILTKSMKEYIDNAKIPMAGKLESELKKSVSDDLALFVEPKMWIEYVSTFSEETLKKFINRTKFLRWLSLIQQEKLQKELGRNIDSEFYSSEDKKALEKIINVRSIEELEKSIRGMYDPLSPYFIEPK